MPNIAIRVDHLSKLYHIGARQQRHDTLRDALSGLLRCNGQQHGDETDFWALRDVSFEVSRGEVIGRNGAILGMKRAAIGFGPSGCLKRILSQRQTVG